MNENYKNQKQLVLDHILTHGSISSLEAFTEYGITRLSAVIFKLRKKGFLIKTETRTGKNRYGAKVSFAVYSMGE